jgi:putative toxin-antitoxin system antitoxin component (TIGR02293 family)
MCRYNYVIWHVQKGNCMMTTSKEKSTVKKTKRPTARSSSHSDYIVVSAARGSDMNSVEARVGRLLTGRVFKYDRLIKILRMGLPVTSVERVMKGLGVASAESLLPIIGMSNRTYARRKQSNQDLTPLESDRLYRLAKIESLAENVLGDKETANDWLQRPNRALGAVPLALLDTEVGTGQVETILTRIEHGVYS